MCVIGGRQLFQGAMLGVRKKPFGTVTSCWPFPATCQPAAEQVVLAVSWQGFLKYAHLTALFASQPASSLVHSAVPVVVIDKNLIAASITWMAP